MQKYLINFIYIILTIGCVGGRIKENATTEIDESWLRRASLRNPYCGCTCAGECACNCVVPNMVNVGNHDGETGGNIGGTIADPTGEGSGQGVPGISNGEDVEGDILDVDAAVSAAGQIPTEVVSVGGLGGGQGGGQDTGYDADEINGQNSDYSTTESTGNTGPGEENYQGQGQGQGQG